MFYMDLLGILKDGCQKTKLIKAPYLIGGNLDDFYLAKHCHLSGDTP